MKKCFWSVLCLLLLLAAAGGNAAARDINLDAIYIKASSPNLQRLVSARLDAYLAVGARFIDSDVAFAGWYSRYRIIYLKEFPGTRVNALCTFDMRTGRRREKMRITGTVVALEVTADGRHVVIKRMVRRRGIVPDNDILVYSITTGRRYSLPSHSVFRDFSLAPEGNSLLHETGRGIEEVAFSPQLRRIAIPKRQYSLIVSTGNPSVAYFSPGRNRYIVLNGGGGRYKGILVGRGNAEVIKGITSPREFFWVDNITIAYRKGYSGNFFVALKNLRTGREKRFAYPSLNTSLHYASAPGILAFTRDQMIQLYLPAEKRLIHTGLEGEDMRFSTDGVHFTSLVCSRLFVVNRYSCIRKRIVLRRSWWRTLEIYRALKSRPAEMDNEFSSRYIGRKITIYSGLLRRGS